MSSEKLPSTKSEKHQELYDAISDIDKIEFAARKLLRKITGDANPEEDKKGMDCPHLEALLSDSPEWIKNRSEKIIGVIGEIKTALYG